MGSNGSVVKRSAGVVPGVNLGAKCVNITLQEVAFKEQVGATNDDKLNSAEEDDVEEWANSLVSLQDDNNNE